MFRMWQRALIAVGCAFALVALISVRLLAEEAAKGQEKTTQSAPAQKPAQPGMADCPYAEAGACCGECQEKAAQGQAAGQDMDCPCKRAKKARKGT